MKLVKLVAQNFMSVGEATVEFRDQGFVLVEGDNRDVKSAESNGAGKSNLFTEALTWVLFGVTTKGVANESVVNKIVGKDTSVYLRFHVGRNRYKLTRYREHSKFGNTVQLIEDSVQKRDLTLSKVADTNALIEQVIGVNKAVFLYAIVLGQGITYRFSQLTDAGRKEVIESILRTSEFDEFRRCSQRCATQASSEVSKLTGSLETLQERLTAEKAELQTLMDLKEKTVKQSDEAKIALQKKLDDLNSKLSDLDLKLSATQEFHDRQVEEQKLLRKSIESMESNLKGLTAVITKDTIKLKELYKRNVKFDRLKEKGICPTCNSKVKPEVLSDLSKANQSEISNLESSTNNLAVEIAKQRKILDGKLKDAESMNYAITNFSSSLKDLGYQRQVIKTQIKELKEKGKATVGEDSNIAKLVEAKLESIKELRDTFKNDSELLEAQKDSTSMYEFWESGFQQIRTKLLEKSLGYLNKRISTYCQALSEGEIAAELRSHSFTKSGERQEKLDLVISTKGGSYDSASGGEKDRVDLAIAFALHDLATKISGFSCNVLIADEPAVFVDAAGIDRLMTLLKEKQDTVESIFLISQSPIFKGYADTVWTVTKRKGLSKLKTH